MDAGVGREPQYDVFADEFLGHARDGFYNAGYDRPACLALLGDVAGKRVLDAACGPGLYAAELIGRGAQVVGFDHSPRMVEICRAHVSQGEFRVHDLADPIAWLPDQSVDLALCALSIEYVDDRVAALIELRRVLRPDGALVLSRPIPLATAPPWGSYRRPDHRVERSRLTVRYWLAPLERTCEEIRRRFVIERRWSRGRCPEAAANDRQRNMNGLPASPGIPFLPAPAPHMRSRALRRHHRGLIYALPGGEGPVPSAGNAPDMAPGFAIRLHSPVGVSGSPELRSLRRSRKRRRGMRRASAETMS
jgi:SAM-dependent methyltransferase